MPMPLKNFYALKSKKMADGSWIDRTDPAKRQKVADPNAITTGWNAFSRHSAFRQYVMENAPEEFRAQLTDPSIVGGRHENDYGTSHGIGETVFVGGWPNAQQLTLAQRDIQSKMEEYHHEFNMVKSAEAYEKNAAAAIARGGKDGARHDSDEQLHVHNRANETGVQHHSGNPTDDEPYIDQSTGYIHVLKWGEGVSDLYDVQPESHQSQPREQDCNLELERIIQSTDETSVERNANPGGGRRGVPYLQLLRRIRYTNGGQLHNYTTSWDKLSDLCRSMTENKWTLTTAKKATNHTEIIKIENVEHSLNAIKYSSAYYEQQADYFQNNIHCLILSVGPGDDSNAQAINYNTMQGLMPFMDQCEAYYLAVSEISKENMYHFHIVVQLTGQRIDSFIRGVKQKYTVWGMESLLTSQKLKSTLFKFLRYVSKEWSESHFQVTSNNKCWMETLKHITLKPELRWTISQQPTGAKITDDITNLMMKTKKYTTKELMDADPKTMMKYLHRGNLDVIVKNCRQFLEKGGTPETIIEEFEDKWRTQSGYWLLNLILLYQGIDPVQFRADFTSWILQLSDKKNTFVLEGPSNAGKSAFIRPLLQLLRYGEIVNGGNFMFEDTVNKQIIIWEEPLIGKSMVDDCKLLFEGSEHKVIIKNKSSEMVGRTPVFITTNKPIWLYCSIDKDALANRCYFYTFRKTVDSKRLLAYCKDHITSSRRQNPCNSKERCYYSPNSGLRRSGISGGNDGKNADTGSPCCYQPNYECRRHFGAIIRGDDDRRGSSKYFEDFYRTYISGPTECRESPTHSGDGSDAERRSSDTEHGTSSPGPKQQQSDGTSGHGGRNDDGIRRDMGASDRGGRRPRGNEKESEGGSRDDANDSGFEQDVQNSEPMATRFPTPEPDIVPNK